MLFRSLNAGTHYFTVYDANNCSVTGAVIITSSSSLSCNTSTTPANCNNNAGTATVNVFGGTAPYSYLWNDGQAASVATGLVAGTYTVTVTDANGCSTICTALVEQPAPILFSLSSTNSTCGYSNGQASIVNLTGGVGGYTYNWNDGQITSSAIGLTAGTYTVIVTDASGCTATQSIVVGQAAPLALSTNVNNVNCNGNNNGAAFVNISGGTPAYQILWNTGDNSQLVAGLAPGIYTVTVTDLSGCTSTASATITEPDALDTLSTSATVASCGLANGTASVSMTGGTPPYTYSWITSPVQTSASATGLAAGTNFVTVTDANGCALTVSVIVPSQSGIGINLNSPVYAGGYNIRCNGGNDGAINMTVSGIGPFTYVWSNGSTDEDLFNLAAGTYTVTVSNNGCTQSASIVLNQSPSWAMSINSIDNQCYGGLSGSASVSVQGGTAPYSYNWSNGGVTQTITGLASATYTVTVSDANGCTQTQSVVINGPSNPLSLTASSNNPSCSGTNNGNINITVTGGTAPYSYMWIDGSTSEDRTNITAGSWTVTVLDAAGCNIQLCIVLSSPNPIVISAVAGNVSCNGGNNGNASASASGGTPNYTYLWNNGSNSAVISNLTAGTYTVTVTDVNGCSSTGSVVVTQPTAISLSVSSTNVTSNGGNDGTASVTASGGTAPYTYAWNTVPVQNVSAAVGLTAGTYQVTVIDFNGCVATASVTITQPNYLCNPSLRPWRTESIVTWAQAPNGNPSQASQYLASNFASAFPSGVVVGGGCGTGKTVTLTSATAVRNFLSGQPNTTANVIVSNYTNPTSATLANKLAAQLVALRLNTRIDAYNANWAPTNTVALENTIISGMTGGLTVFNGMTVGAFMAEANKKLGGCTATPSATALDYANACEAINLAYNAGVVVNPSLLSCPSGVNKLEQNTSDYKLNVNVYPNPTSGMLNLNFESMSDAKVSIRLFDITGNVVWFTEQNAFEGINERTYDLSQLAKGVYMMRISLDKSEQIVRIVIQ